jgi:hypothetical protein
MGKPDLRGAAERLERGIERYGEGDLVAAAVEFEEAIRLAPEHARARQYLSWVRDVLAGTRGSGRKKELDEDAVRAVTEALDAGEESEQEAPWNPVPITPPNRHPSSPLHTIPFGLDEAAAVRSSHNPRLQSYREGVAPTELAVAIPSELTGKPTSSSTILGIAPPREGVLPGRGRRPAHDDRPESVTREFARGTPTLHNLAPLDVPELTEEQVAELISLESTLPTTGPGGRPLTPDLASTADLPTEQRLSFIDLEPRAPELEPRAPEREMPRLPELQRVTQPLPIPRPDRGLKLAPPPFASDFEPLETPTRSLDEKRPLINPLPVDEPHDPGDLHDDENVQNPTNVYLRGHDLAPDEPGEAADEPGEAAEELTPIPTGRVHTPKPSIADIMGQAKRVLLGGDAQTAVDVADDVVTAAGGIDAEACLPYLSLLETIYTAMIGPLDQVPRHGTSVPDLDPRAAFLLSRIDGNISIDDLLEVSGMPRLEAMRVLALLIRHGAVVTS